MIKCSDLSNQYLALDVRYSQYCFRTEFQIILDNITVTILIYSLTIAAFIMIII